MTTITIPRTIIELQPGEWHAGAVLKDDGSVDHYTIVCAFAPSGKDFNAAQLFGTDKGVDAPSPEESRLICNNHQGRLPGLRWFWTNKPHEDASYAWLCYLPDGHVSLNHRDYQGGAVAVRRFNP